MRDPANKQTNKRRRVITSLAVLINQSMYFSKMFTNTVVSLHLNGEQNSKAETGLTAALIMHLQCS